MLSMITRAYPPKRKQIPRSIPSFQQTESGLARIGPVRSSRQRRAASKASPRTAVPGALGDTDFVDATEARSDQNNLPLRGSFPFITRTSTNILNEEGNLQAWP